MEQLPLRRMKYWEWPGTCFESKVARYGARGSNPPSSAKLNIMNTFKSKNLVIYGNDKLFEDLEKALDRSIRQELDENLDRT